MATNLTDIIKKVRTALRGEEVRGSIADGLEYCGQISENAKADMEATAASTKEQLSKDIDAKAAAALKSIPESYTELDGSVKQLEEDIDNLYSNGYISVNVQWGNENGGYALTNYFTKDEIQDCYVELTAELPSETYIIFYAYDSNKEQIDRVDYYDSFRVSKFRKKDIAYVRIEAPVSILKKIFIFKPKKYDVKTIPSNNKWCFRNEDLLSGYIDYRTGVIEASSNVYVYTPFIEVEKDTIYDVVRIDEDDKNVFEHFNMSTYILYDQDYNFIYGSNIDFTRGLQTNNLEYTNDVYIHSNNAAYIKICSTKDNVIASRNIIFGKQEYIDTIIGTSYICEPYFDNDTLFNVIDIKNPFISKEASPRNYIHLKFDYIVYSNGYRTFKYTWNMFKNDITNSGLHGCYFIDYTKNASTPLNIPNTFEMDDIDGYGKIIFDVTKGKAFNVLKTYDNNKYEITLAIFDKKNVLLDGLIHDFYSRALYDTLLVEKNRISRDVIESIKVREEEIISEIDSLNFNMIFYTDAHNSFTEALSINMVAKDLNPDCILCGGDTDLGDGRLNAIKVVTSFLSKIEYRKKLIHCEGNHDRGITNPLNRRELFTLTASHLIYDENVSIVSANRLYYYKDYTKKKIRIIVLTLYNTDNEDYNDAYGWDGEQMEWFANTALKTTPYDYHVVVVAHCAPLIDSDGWGGILNHPNKNVCRGILESFVAGTSVTLKGSDTSSFITEYSVTTNFNKSGNLIGMFTGHGHLDKYLKLNGVNYIETDCGYIDTTQDVYPSDRTPLTYTEILMDYVSIDTTNRTVTLKRIGYGDDRSYNY